MLWGFIIPVGIFIIFIASINYMNLATAKAAARAKEIGIRKITGAKKTDIIKQFFGESVLYSIIAFIFSLFLAAALLPVLNSILGENFIFSQDIIGNPGLFIKLFLIAVLIGLISGSYPALLLSSFKPAQILKFSFNT